MNKEEAIERCKQIIKDNNEVIKEARKNRDINSMQLTASLDNDSIAIETVLNLLEKEQNRIQELEKALIDDDYKHRAEIQKKDKQIEQYQNMLATNDMLHVLECEKKDKTIDLMAEEISKSILNTCPLADYNVDLDCENKCKDNYKECWKKYFENKVEEDK